MGPCPTRMFDKLALKKKFPKSWRISKLFRNMLSNTFISKDLRTRPAPRFLNTTVIDDIADKYSTKIVGTSIHNIDIAIALRTNPKLEHLQYTGQSKSTVANGFQCYRPCTARCDTANPCKHNPELIKGKCNHEDRHSTIIPHECVACGVERESNESKRRRTNESCNNAVTEV